MDVTWFVGYVVEGEDLGLDSENGSLNCTNQIFANLLVACFSRMTSSREWGRSRKG